MRVRALFELFRVQRYVLARHALLPVLADPVFPALARRHVPPGEGQGGDIGVADGNLPAPSLGHDADKRIVQGSPRAAIENIAFHYGAVLACDLYVATVVESLLQRRSHFFRPG